MEKVLYLAWRPDDLDRRGFADRLVDEVGPALVDAGARGVQVNVADDAVAAGLGELPDGQRIVATRPQMEAVVSVWLDSSVPARRSPIDAVFTAAGLRVAGYLVVESEPLANTAHPPAPGERTAGFAQLAFLRRPAALERAAWLERWREHHTPIAIATQSTFEYRQNLVVEQLVGEGPELDAVVEEAFPIEALTDPAVFYDAVGDPERQRANATAMFESVQTFIDLAGGIDVVPTSQHVVARAFPAPTA